MLITHLGLTENIQHLKKSDSFVLDPEGNIMWRVVNDDVIGGLSFSQLQRTTQNKSWIFKGTLSRANNGGFASIRINNRDNNLTNFSGIEIKVRGDGKQYGLSLYEDHYFTGFFYHQSFITRREVWMVVQFNFDHFLPKYFGRPFDYVRKVDRSQIKEIALMIGDKQAGEFQLEIAWIKLIPR